MNYAVEVVLRRVTKIKKSIKSALSQELCVTKMVLALLYRSECKTVESKLPNYKIFPIEPSYNIPGHNKNIYDQSPCHLVKEEKNILEHVITAFFLKKKNIIIVTTYCQEKVHFFAE